MTQLVVEAKTLLGEVEEYDVQPQKEALWKYKQELATDEQKSQESYDKMLTSLSGGALGISITLVQFFDKTGLTGQWLLITAWVSWTLSLTGVLWSFWISVRQLRETMKLIDARTHQLKTFNDCEELHGQLTKDRFSPWIRRFNFWSGTLFCIGAMAFAIFAFVNL
jgi:hypothetical protein